MQFLTSGQCEGCRKGKGMYPQCAVKDCFKEKKVNFCGECDEFPCTKNKYPQELEKRWLDNNYKIKNEGVEKYYYEQKDKPCY